MEEKPDKQQRVIAAYKTVAALEHWKLIDENLSLLCGEDRDLFDRNSARQTDYNLGAASVLAHIRWMIKRKVEKKQEKVIS